MCGTVLTVTSSETKPDGTSGPPTSDRVHSYVSLELEGSFADSVSEGSFTLDVGEGGADPEAVSVHRYDGTEWQELKTEPLDASTVRLTSPVGYSVFAIGSSEAETDQTPTPATATPPDTSEPTDGDTATPEGTSESDTSATPTADATDESDTGPAGTHTPAESTETPQSTPVDGEETGFPSCHWSSSGWSSSSLPHWWSSCASWATCKGKLSNPALVTGDTAVGRFGFRRDSQ